jgi:hypothetical protein
MHVFHLLFPFHLVAYSILFLAPTSSRLMHHSILDDGVPDDHSIHGYGNVRAREGKEHKVHEYVRAWPTYKLDLLLLLLRTYCMHASSNTTFFFFSFLHLTLSRPHHVHVHVGSM